MAQLHHNNVVGLIGVCTKEYPLLLVLQFCEHGSLLSLLRRRTGFDALSLQQRLRVSLDCANGMAHLSTLGMVHRDLAARNVLVDSSYTAKVADFGLSRRMDNETYYRWAPSYLPHAPFGRPCGCANDVFRPAGPRVQTAPCRFVGPRSRF